MMMWPSRPPPLLQQCHRQCRRRRAGSHGSATVIVLLFFCTWISIYVPFESSSDNSDSGVFFRSSEAVQKLFKTSTTTAAAENDVATAVAESSAVLIKDSNGNDAASIGINGSTSTNTSSTGSSLATAEETDDEVEPPEEAVVVDVDIPPFWPNRAMERYKERHSHRALLAKYEAGGSSDQQHRKFAVAYYWCPDRAGNVLHNLFNTVAWAMITNRTVLWKYDNYSNAVDDCQQVMERASWIPAWDEWSTKLQLEDPVPVPIDRNRRQYDAQHRTVIFPQIPDLDYGNPALYRNTWRQDPLSTTESRYYINDMDRESKTRAGMMYNLGVNYLFGMLFRECFTLRVNATTASSTSSLLLSSQQQSQSSRKNNNALSIALHSRHPVVGDDGTFLEEEIACLEQLLEAHKDEEEEASSSNRTASWSGCQVYLMSDRPRTVEILSRWLVERNCTPISARHAVADGHTEHGVWAGVGFIEDLAIASQARWAVIGDFHRSSFMLLVELIEYDRLVEAGAVGEEETIADLKACTLQEKPSSGYNYGPGTPIFRHHTLQDPLPPMEVMEQYKTRHSVEALLRQSQSSSPSQQGRRYVRVFYSCSSSPSDEGSVRSHHFLNGLLWALSTNRTLLWDSNGDCDEILLLRDWMPSYQEWASRLQLDDTVDLVTDGQSMTTSDGYGNVADIQMVSFPYLPGKMSDLSTVNILSPMNGTTQQNAIRKLYSLGADFLYGMLFDHSFKLTSLVRSAEPANLPADPSFLSIALNLRQENASTRKHSSDDNTSAEQCLQSVLSHRQEERCHVYIGADQNETLAQISDWLTARNCTVWSANSRSGEENDVGATDKGGYPPSELLRYFQNVAMLSKARSVLVGYDADATANSLTVELIDYYRRLEVWRLGRDPPLLTKFTICTVPAED